MQIDIQKNNKTFRTARTIRTFRTSLCFLILFCGVFGLTEKSNATTPTISNVAGTIASGQTLTITGTTMMDEDKTNWFSQFRTGTPYGFEGNNPSDDSYEYGYGTPSFYSSSVKLMGDKSYKATLSGEQPAYGGTGTDIYIFNSSSCYIRFYVRFHNNYPEYASIFQKMLYDNNGFYFQPDVSVLNGNGTPYRWLWVRDSGGAHESTYVNNPNGAIEQDKWYCIENYWDYSATSLSAWIDGIQVLNGVDSGTIPQAVMIGIINAGTASSSFNTEAYFDNFTVSAQRIYPSSIIEIGNSLNYETATKKYQAPVYLSDGSIQITEDLTDLGSGPYYLWVTNNKQERSTAYSLSESSDTTPPASPSGLSVS